MSDRYIRNKKGLSLIEVLLASALLLIVFTGFINAFYYSTNLRVNSQNRLQALLKAQTCIEEIRASRGDISGQWSDFEELKNWLENSEGFSKDESGVYKKNNLYVKLTSPGSGIPEKLIGINVEAVYEDKMNKGEIRSVKLQTRLREF